MISQSASFTPIQSFLRPLRIPIIEVLEDVQLLLDDFDGTNLAIARKEWEGSEVRDRVGEVRGDREYDDTF